MTLLAPLITGFLRDYMPRQRGYSSHSCDAYAYSFRLLFTYAAKRLRTKPSRLQIEQLDAALVMDFLGHIERERGNGATTRNLRLAAIKTFMRYVEYHLPSALEQIGQIHAIPTKRHDQVLIRHLVMEEVRAILNAPDLTTRLGVRDRAMMHLCFAAGLRVSELVEARRQICPYSGRQAFRSRARVGRSDAFRSGRRLPPIYAPGSRYEVTFAFLSSSSMRKVCR